MPYPKCGEDSDDAAFHLNRPNTELHVPYPKCSEGPDGAVFHLNRPNTEDYMCLTLSVVRVLMVPRFI